VRELENILERALAFANDGIIEVADLGLKPAGCMAPAMPTALVAAAAPEAPTTAVSSPPHTAGTAVGAAAAGTAVAMGELPHSLPDHLDDVERDIIRRALEKTRYNRTQAAELLGISFRQLRYRMQRLGIQEPD
jgi:two-component system response regulator PilR (NtrC family)